MNVVPGLSALIYAGINHSDYLMMIYFLRQTLKTSFI